MEDKQKICDLLCKTLQATRGHYDLVALRYIRISEDREEVEIEWEGGTQKVNVSLDSGVAMIRDIMEVMR